MFCVIYIWENVFNKNNTVYCLPGYRKYFYYLVHKYIFIYTCICWRSVNTKFCIYTWSYPVNWNCHIVNFLVRCDYLIYIMTYCELCCYIRQYIKTAMFIILYLRTSSKCTAKLTIYHILILLHTPTKKIHYLTIMEAEKYILTWSSV